MELHAMCKLKFAVPESSQKHLRTFLNEEVLEVFSKKSSEIFLQNRDNPIQITPRQKFNLEPNILAAPLAKPAHGNANPILFSAA